MSECSYIDSPFHNAFEDEQLKSVRELKKRFCEILSEKILTIPGAKNVEFIHTDYGNYITVISHLDIYKVRLRYDLNMKQFQEPFTTFEHMPFPINGGRIYGFYREANHELTQHVITIIGYFYEVSQMSGFGNQYGNDWGNCISPNILAKAEFRRLLDESRKMIHITDGGTKNISDTDMYL